MNDLRTRIQAQRQLDAEQEARRLSEQRTVLRDALGSLLGAELVAALPNLRDARYGEGPALDFDFGKLTFRIFRNYQYSGLTLLPMGLPSSALSTHFLMPKTFLRALGEYEEEAFGEDQA